MGKFDKLRQGSGSSDAESPSSTSSPADTPPRDVPLIDREAAREALDKGVSVAQEAGRKTMDLLKDLGSRGASAAEASAQRMRENRARRAAEATGKPSGDRLFLGLKPPVLFAIAALFVAIVGGAVWATRTPAPSAPPSAPVASTASEPNPTPSSSGPATPAKPAAPNSPPIAATVQEPVTSLPPPTAVSAAACPLAAAPSVGIAHLKRPPTPVEEAWMRFAYACLERGLLVAQPEGGFALPGSHSEASAPTTAAAVSSPVNGKPAAIPADAVTLLPAPSSVSASSCTMAAPFATKVGQLKRAPLPQEEAWLKLGYACLDKSLLTTAADGTFVVPEKPLKPEPAKVEKPAKGDAIATSETGAASGAPGKAKAEKANGGGSAAAGKSKSAGSAAVAEAATYAITPQACAAHIADFNAVKGKSGTLSKGDADRKAQAQACLGLGYIGSSSMGYVATAGATPVGVPGAPTAAAPGGVCGLKGVVLTQDGGVPLAGATVSITGLGIAASGSTTTDANGGWSFSGLPQGSVSVTISAKKHFSQKATLQTCGVVSAPVTLETCNILTCKARELDQKLGLGRH